ncbi:hypothetical protein DFH07DRAFT_967631 [Mycena maculata]|uniref:Uncharacterized protein n=1 Tax=Mycena maculata TaxID=230809 RepID=A0AAD7MVV6_9AGAR|nr:hypothetical protein DFH07DRAFT_967631 [Mycena maculata]
MAFCAPDPSADALVHFSHYIDLLNQNELSMLLPIFHTALEPARIPMPSQMDGNYADVEHTVWAAVISFRSILFATVPPGAAPDVWPRLWAWFQFFQLFRAFFQRLGNLLLTESQMGWEFIRFAATMVVHRPNEDLILRTAGFQALAARVWRSLVEDVDIPCQTDRLTILLALLSLSPESIVPNQLFEGAGGTAADLALVVIANLAVILPDGITELSVAQLDNLSAVLRIVASVDQIGDQARSRPLCLARAEELVRYLTVALCVASETAATAMVCDVIPICLSLLLEVFMTPQGYRQLQVAVRNGLLRGILLSGQTQFPEDVSRLLPLLLTHVLAPATVKYEVLVELQTAYSAVAKDATAELSPPTAEAWAKFSRILAERLEVLKIFNSTDQYHQGGLRQHPMRDHPNARFSTGNGAIANHVPITVLGTRVRSHSVEITVRLINTGLGINTDYSSRGLSFMCALLDHDYQAARVTASSQIFTAAEPVWFDYRSADLTVEVQAPVADFQLPPDIVRRASDSTGCISIHILYLSEGKQSRAFVIPLRTPKILNKVDTAMYGIHQFLTALPP